MTLLKTTLILNVLLLSGCSSIIPSSPAPVQRVQVPYAAPSSQKKAHFHKVMMKVAHKTREDKQYHRIGLQSEEEKQWFKDLMYRLWDRQITRTEFISEGTARYPTHRYEFNYIANAYQGY